MKPLHLSLSLSLLAAVAASAGAGGNYGPSDAEVLTVLAVINQNEIAAADAAEAKSASPQVLSFAKMMQEHHKEGLEKAEKMLKDAGPAPVDAAESEPWRARGQKDVEELSVLEGPRFNTAYMDLVVKAHGEVLRTIDQKLLKKARSKEVKQHLRETRARVASHLAQARDIQASLPR